MDAIRFGPRECSPTLARFLQTWQTKLTPANPDDSGFYALPPSFLFASDLCQAWLKFGGLVPQLAHLSTVLHLSIAETVGASHAYRRLVSQKLQEKARKRTALEADFAALLATENFTLGEQAEKEISSAADTDVKDKATKQKANGKG